MDKRAAGAATSGGASESYPSVDSLLREGSFYQRLEKARLMRAEALARLEAVPDTMARRPVQGRTTEKPEPVPTPDKTDLFVLNPSRPFVPDATETLPVAKLYPLPKATHPSPVAEVDAEPDLPAAPRLGRRLKILGGFGLGVAAGVALALLLPLINAGIWSRSSDGSSVAAPVVSSRPIAESSNQDAAERLVVSGQDAALDRQVGSGLPPVSADEAVALLPALPSGPKIESRAPKLAASELAEFTVLSPAVLLASSSLESAPTFPLFRPGAPDTALGTQPPPDPVVSGSAIPLEDLHIRVLIPAGMPKSEIGDLAASLQKAGFGMIKPDVADVAIRKSQVKYYYTADLAAASQVAAATGAALRNLTSFRPLPPPGTIDVRIASKVKAPAKAKKPAHKTAVPTTPDQKMLALRAKILQQLQGASN